MREINKHYLEIMKIELEDLKEDIGCMIEECRKKLEVHLIKDNVFFANLALFKNELLGVDEFFKILDKTDPNRFSTLGELIDHLRINFSEKINTFGLAEAVHICIERKLQKVAKYVMQKPPISHA